jgi:hypothetical protein
VKQAPETTFSGLLRTLQNNEGTLKNILPDGYGSTPPGGAPDLKKGFIPAIMLDKFILPENIPVTAHTLFFTLGRMGTIGDVKMNVAFFTTLRKKDLRYPG